MARLPPTRPQRFTPEPGDHPPPRHGRSGAEVLEGRAREAAVATLTQINAPDAWREAPLHPRPSRLVGYELRRFLPSACGLDRLGGGLRPDGELPGGVLRRGAYRTGGTRATGGPVTPEAHDRIARDLATWRPWHTAMPLRAMGLLGVPMHAQGRHVSAMGELLWPARGPTGRPDPIDLVLTLRGDQEGGIHVAAVEEGGARP